MSFFSAVRQALESLLAHKSRSFLTSLGIIIGISAVIAMVSAGSGARQKLNSRLENSGKNLILIRPGSRAGMGLGSDLAPLTADDAEAIAKEAGSYLVGAVPWQVTPRMVTTATTRAATVLVGTTAEFPRVGSWTLVHGRCFTDGETKKLARVCMLGQTVCQKLFPDNPNPIGESVQLQQVKLTIIGVMGPKGYTPLGVDQDDQIFTPLTTLERFVVGSENIAMILATARSEDSIEPAKAAITRVLRRQHHLRPGDFDDFDVSSVRELAQLAVTVANVMQILVAVIASISLVVGGIGIMNVMLVSVTERTREIGIRMSVGATPSDVLTQFLIEAVVLAAVGGVIGTSLGLLGAVGLARVANWPVIVSPGLILLAFGITAGVGVFFGYYPAWKASRLDPIVALRFE